MACKTSCKLCPHLVISQAVTFANDTLTINIPAGAYQNGEKYCIVVAQSIPDTTTINAPVVITIGAGTTAYPLTDCNCAQATAESIHTRTRYATRVATLQPAPARLSILAASAAPTPVRLRPFPKEVLDYGQD